jgi:glyoxylase-like metal-dependent hydrolase (beta-lactamase superfamily II)
MQYAHERARTRYLLSKPRALPIVLGLLRTRAFWPQPIGAVERFETGVLPVPGSPRVISTPGHTMGHCSLHFPDRDAVLAGDAVVMLDPYTAERGPRIVAGAATADSARALRSLDALAATGARAVLTGHGETWRLGAEEAAVRARSAGQS